MPTLEEEIQRAIESLGPAGAFEKFIAANDALIASNQWDIGRRIVSERTEIYTGLVKHWAGGQHARFGYDKPFAMVALGGTGRGEMAPFSDNDFGFLFDDTLEGNHFLLELQQQVLHTDSFKRDHGFVCEALPFSLDEVSNLDGKQLNSFIDMRAVYDPVGLTETFRERIRATYDPFEHFLHIRDFWKSKWAEAADGSEDVGVFDIKNEGLRVFLAGVWVIGGADFTPSLEVYKMLEDHRDLEAYEFLMRIRTLLHLQKGRQSGGANGNHPQDVMKFEDFVALGEVPGSDMDEEARFGLGNEIRSRFLAARRRVALFAKDIIQGELKRGRAVNPGSSIVYGSDGLQFTGTSAAVDNTERSRNALALLLASQRYRTPIDLSELRTTFRDAGDWLEPSTEVASLFYEENGSLADTFGFLAQLVGVEERIFPGYAKFETSLDERVMTEGKSLRGKLQRDKIRALERFVREGRAALDSSAAAQHALDLTREINVRIEAALLDQDHVAAIKLALKTKRLPLTDEDQSVRNDPASSRYERYSSGFSGIPLDEYFEPFINRCGFDPDAVDIAKFLVANRRSFKAFAEAGIADDQLVGRFSELCGSESRLRALFVFTCADRVDWASESVHPTRWFNIKELYGKTLRRFRPSADPTGALAASGYSPEELEILKDFGRDFFGGRYRHYANRFGSRLLQLAEDPDFNEPKVAVLHDGASVILGVAARDQLGLAATICGALWNSGVGLRQAHLFSATTHGLAMNFFHLVRRDGSYPGDLAATVERAIIERRHIGDSDEANVPALNGDSTYHEWRPNQYCLRFVSSEDNDGLVYALTWRMYHHLRADIFALTATAARGQTFVSIYHNLPQNQSFEEARQIVAERF